MPMITRTDLIAINKDPALYEAYKRSYLRGSLGKDNRPWFLRDMTKRYPQGKSLVGLEIETGWPSTRTLTSAMEWLWMNTMYTTVDREGCGAHPCEVTFPPFPLGEDTTDEAQLMSFIEQAADNLACVTMVTNSDMSGQNVGTHINVSTPYLRSSTDAATRRMMWMNMMFSRMRDDGLFFFVAGRTGYGSTPAYCPDSNSEATRRIEFKLFHTTFHPGQFANYLKITRRLVELCEIEDVAALPADHWEAFEYIMQDIPERTVIAAGNTQYSPELRISRPPTRQ